MNKEKIYEENNKNSNDKNNKNINNIISVYVKVKK
jgi:hypothetical protein